jgi:hypothetical protein
MHCASEYVTMPREVRFQSIELKLNFKWHRHILRNAVHRFVIELQDITS